MHGFGVRPRVVLRYVWRDHIALEIVGQVEDVVRDTQLLGHPARVIDVGHRAAPRVRRATPQLERGPDDVMTLLHQERGRDGKVDAS